MEYRYHVKEGVLTLKDDKKGLEVVSYEGEDIYLTIPGRICVEEKCGDPSVHNPKEPGYKTEKPVISIGKKAMLSCKSLRRVRLPETIEEVGDWAFAYCDSLKELCLPGKEIRFGRGIFRECGRLCRVSVEGKQQDTGGLLAAAVTLLDAPYLFTPVRCGDEDWLKQWDARMLQILRAADQEGYSKMVLCGEEDYGSRENNLDYFLNRKRRSKVRIAFMRLLHPPGLQDEVKRELEQYLREHTMGCLPFKEGSVKEAPEKEISPDQTDGDVRAGDETWQVLLSEHGGDSEYYKLFTQIGCLSEENFDRILSETGENYPEMKAWFLKYKEEIIGYADFFEALRLD